MKLIILVIFLITLANVNSKTLPQSLMSTLENEFNTMNSNNNNNNAATGSVASSGSFPPFTSVFLSASKEFCSTEFLRGQFVETQGRSSEYFYSSTYVVSICNLQGPLVDLNNLQIFDNLNLTVPPGYTSVQVVNVTVIPQDAFTSNFDCISLVNQGNELYTFLNVFCNGKNFTCCNNYTTHPFNPFPKTSGYCNEQPDCCLRYTVTVTVRVIGITGPTINSCPTLPIKVTNCIFSNATICNCDALVPEMMTTKGSFNTQEEEMILFNNAEKMHLGRTKKNNKLISSFFDKGSQKQLLSQCGKLPSVCGTDCIESFIPPPISIFGNASFNCFLDTSNPCDCNAGQNCSFLKVRCVLNYTDPGQTPQRISATLSESSSPSTNILYTISTSSNCVAVGNSSVSINCSLSSYDTAYVIVDYCFQQQSSLIKESFSLSATITDACSGTHQFTSSPILIVIPAQIVKVRIFKYSVQKKDFICGDLNFPNGTIRQCEDYVVGVVLEEGCISANTMVVTDDLTSFLQLGAQMSNLISSLGLSCGTSGNQIVCNFTQQTQPGIYSVNYTLCFCNCDFCANSTSRVIPLSNTATLSLGNTVIDSRTLPGEIICPCFKQCTGCTNQLINSSVSLPANTCFQLSNPKSTLPSNIPIGATCSLTSSVNGSSILAKWVFDGTDWVVIDDGTTILNSHTINGVKLVSTANYSLSCCAPRISTAVCNINGTIQINCEVGQIFTNYNWDCSGAVPPCPLISLPPSPCNTSAVSVNIGSAIIDSVQKVLPPLNNKNLKQNIACDPSITKGFTVSTKFDNVGTDPFTLVINSISFTLNGGSSSLGNPTTSSLGWTCTGGVVNLFPCSYATPINPGSINQAPFVVEYDYSISGTKPLNVSSIITVTATDTLNPFKTDTKTRSLGEICL